MAADVSPPPVVLFFEGTSTREMFQKIVSGLQRGGRRVHVFAAGAMTPTREPVRKERVDPT